MNNSFYNAAKHTRMEEMTLEEIVQRIANSGDQNAFRELFRRYYNHLLYFSNSFVKCKEVAEEIVEDVFVSVWNNRGNLLTVSNLKTYLYVAVKNHSINYLERSGYPFHEDLNLLDVSYIDVSPNPEDLVIASEMSKAINKAVAELPPKCRMIFKLVKEDGLRYKEVADILNISDRTVENHIARALRKIAGAIHIDLKTLSPVASDVLIKEGKRRRN